MSQYEQYEELPPEQIFSKMTIMRPEWCKGCHWHCSGVFIVKGTIIRIRTFNS